ncbi:DUF2169 domain-containing protein [Oceanicola sp. 502str15]|uniref:DUF2169 family type VI secretion system accessory protein n=1 Tax=Oceanicola sp. 502str15 TaxID=2696061 RepID=UPI0020952B38|nr:DUF2169 domain-containing protein [Oceanicola sp. 502str15]MCO6383328.1 DUF2169 domain-containing protein [Oceanicola sp. 502str15]
MKLSTSLPLATLFFKHWHVDDTEVGIVLAKAEFARGDAGAFGVLPRPPELEMADVFEGDPAITPLLAEQDLAPGKLATDLTVKAIARAPGGEARRDWAVGVEVEGRGSHGFHVRGPSRWSKPSLRRWQLGKPEPVREVPITYALAYGGLLPEEGETPARSHDFNPAGTGFADKAYLDLKSGFDAPQIGELAEFMAADPLAGMAVRGFGPIAKAWLPRRGHAGTFDDLWKRERHPRMPADYDLAFWNAAPGPLQFSPHLTGNEMIRLHGVSHEAAPVEVPLPAVGLVLEAEGDDSVNVPMHLDTVQIDIAKEDPATHRVLLTWRALLPNPAGFTHGTLLPTDLGD